MIMDLLLGPIYNFRMLVCRPTWHDALWRKREFVQYVLIILTVMLTKGTIGFQLDSCKTQRHFNYLQCNILFLFRVL